MCVWEIGIRHKVDDKGWNQKQLCKSKKEIGLSIPGYLPTFPVANRIAPIDCCIRSVIRNKEGRRASILQS